MLPGQRCGGGVGAKQHFAAGIGTFGPHGDLKPAHIVLHGGGRVRFLDPLVPAGWIGSAGYTLGPPGGEATADMHDRERRSRDLGALVAIAAELAGESVGWSAGRARQLANKDGGTTDLRAHLESAFKKTPTAIAKFGRTAGNLFLDQFESGDVLSTDAVASALV